MVWSSSPKRVGDMRLEEKRRSKRLAAGDDSALLPPEVLELIILRLPLVSIIQARCVCRNWNKEIASTSFAERKAKLDHELGRVPKGWLITMIGRYKKKWVWIYDPETGRHHRISLPAHLKGNFDHAVAIGGLLFMERETLHEEGASRAQFCAWNPITGFTKELTFPIRHQLAVVATHLNHKLHPLQQAKNPGQIILGSSIIKPSAGCCWSRLGVVQTFVHQRVLGTYSRGFLFSTECFRDRVVTAFNVVTGESSGIDLPRDLDRFCRWGLKLVECGGNVLLVAACTPSRRRADHLQVWRLKVVSSSGGKWEWELVNVMPEDLFEVVFRGVVTQYNWRCAGVDDTLLICSTHRRVEEQEGVVELNLKSYRWKKIERMHHARQHCPWSSPAPFYPSFAALE